MNWLQLTSLEQLDQIAERSKAVPCLLFKHSTRCSISAMAKHRLEAEWDFSPDAVEPYYLDLIAFRPVSSAIAERFSVYHESPQVLLVKDGVCFYDASHLDITVAELKAALSSPEYAGTSK